jgi:hypothetical protein
VKSERLVQSVRQRLLNLSRERQEDFQVTLVHFAIERLLYRLSLSEVREQFLLKGAMLFVLWTGQVHRPTRDLDLAGRGDPSADALVRQFRQICATATEEDGLRFDADSIQVEVIREQQAYEGQRVRLLAYLGTARIPLQIDIGFGDAVTPSPQRVAFPTLLDLPAPWLRAYPKETVVAEKLHAMITLGMINSRMKDFYDLDWIARSFAFDGALLVAAIRATFARRQTAAPSVKPICLTAAFAQEPDKQLQWQAFLQRSGLTDQYFALDTVVSRLSLFLMPPLQTAAQGVPWLSQWTPGSGWQPEGDSHSHER